MLRNALIVLGIAVLVGSGTFLLLRERPPTQPPAANEAANRPVGNANVTTVNVNGTTTATTTEESLDEVENRGEESPDNARPLTPASSVPNAASAFQFSVRLPASWRIEAVPAIEALNVYDPAADGATNLQKSRVFIRHFRASDFQTLTTVTIKSRTEATFAGRPAVTYRIGKKPDVADFPNQPSWRNAEHRVTDIRSSDASPTTFYVFAKAPDVPDATFDALLQSLTFETTLSVQYPLDGFLDRITKKRFGQHITPATSPVQPERFSGYHTGVDAETTAADADIDVPVYAIADGTIRLVRWVSGYGGVVMIEHSVDGQTSTALYGHLRLSSVTRGDGEPVTVGERIAVLGTDGTAETDRERKHLHLGLLKGRSIDLRGYVAHESQLSAWEHPIAWFERQGLK